MSARQRNNGTPAPQRAARRAPLVPNDDPDVLAAFGAPARPAPPARMSSGVTTAARYSDVFNAARFSLEHRDALRFSPDLGWLAWDGRRWARDGLRPLALAQDTARHVARDAAGDPDLRPDEAAKAVRSLLGSGTVSAMVNLARPHLAVATDALDADPWALNCANGTVDLRTGQLRAHRPEDYITKLCPVDFDPGATAPQWEAFLARILPDPEVCAFVQRFLGYCCTGLIRDHVFAVFHGKGANGKGTLVETVLHILGSYGRQIPPETLMSRSSDAHPTERASLLGMRFVASSETEENRRLNEALVKQLTGGDTISARFMRQDFFEFRPTHKLALSTNHKPVVKGTDHGIWRRLRLVPFDVQIPEEEQDKALPEKLRAEALGILAWLVAGCLAWQRDGLGCPEAVRVATEGYRNEMDVLGLFIEEKCVVERTAKGTAAELYIAYGRWCGEHGERAVSQRAFAEALLERGFERGRGGHDRTRLWLGIGLAADAADAADTDSRIHSSSRYEAEETPN